MPAMTQPPLGSGCGVGDCFSVLFLPAGPEEVVELLIAFLSPKGMDLVKDGPFSSWYFLTLMDN